MTWQFCNPASRLSFGISRTSSRAAKVSGKTATGFRRGGKDERTHYIHAIIFISKRETKEIRLNSTRIKLFDSTFD